MTATLLFMTLMLLPLQDTPQDRPPVPRDSIELVLTGCLKGRILAVSDVRQVDVQSGPIVRARSFRLTGKGDVMKSVKREDRHFVEVTGLVKKSALVEPGMKIGKGIVISGGTPTAGAGRSPDPATFVPVMDVQSLRLRSTSCSQ